MPRSGNFDYPTVSFLGGVVKETGQVKWFNAAKGYGFLTRSDGQDVFVHHSSIMGDGDRKLEEGDEVEFEVKEGPKGLQAHNVKARGEGATGESSETTEGDVS